MSKHEFKEIIGKTRVALDSRQGHNVMLYLLFACVAFVFWLILSLDTEVQREFEIPVTVTDIPDSVVLLGNPPVQLNVSVSGKGSQLLSFNWGRVPTFKLKFLDNIGKRGAFYVSRGRLESKVRDYFGSSVQVLGVRPDSILVKYTSAPGVEVPLKVNCDVTPNLQCIISGPITVNYDSVRLYSDRPIPPSIKFAETERIVRTELKDTTVVVVDIKKIAGVRTIPDKVKVTIPVEPLISKRRPVTIDVVNLPHNVGFLTFPSTVEVSYLVPMSKFNNDDYPIKVFVDYNSIGQTDLKAKVNIAPAPEIFHNMTLSVDSVEYVVERRNS